MEEQLYRLAEQWAGKAPERVEMLAGAGSNRRYYRFGFGGKSCIGVVGTSTDENRAFVYLARLFHSKGLPVPGVYAVSEDYSCYLQDDLGSLSLFDAVKQGRESGCFSDSERALLTETIAQLPRFQFEGAKSLDFSQCYPQPSFDHRTVMWDLNYFKYSFLKLTGVEFREDLLENDFESLATALLDEEYDTFMYRDFQSRNVVIKEDKPYFIDFQGGRRGPVYYDVASFTGQAKANFPDSVKAELIRTYLDALKPYRDISEDAFCEKLRLFSFFRTLQVLGAYGFRGYIEQKSHFVQSIPFAIKQLRALLPTITRTPYLAAVLDEVVGLKRFAPLPNADGLTVTVTSFSYHKGIPADMSGNGGGFVFDCRALPNPGRYDEYKQLTGRDRPVIDFFARHREIYDFIDEVKPLVDRAVGMYMKRGFNSLMVSFGCTGGQHRSVFAAEQMAAYIARIFGVRVVLKHREQAIEQVFSSSKIIGKQ